MRALFESDSRRFDRFSIQAAGLLLDYSKHFVTAETMRLLVALAEARELRTWIGRLTSGERINVTEDRPVLHTALRSHRPVMLDGRDVTQDVKRVRAQMRRFTDALRASAVKGATGRAITDVINIGIGGSDLGPALAAEALAPYAASNLRVHFMSNVDGAHVEAVLDGLDPETTLAIVASKTFSTQETLTNAKSVRAWLERAVGERAGEHFAAVTANTAAARSFGIAPERTFEFWDWVGGRYSMWSAVGLPIAAAAGMDAFEAMCDGAQAMDEHFATAPFDRNMPAVLALLGVLVRRLLRRFRPRGSAVRHAAAAPARLSPAARDGKQREARDARRRDGRLLDVSGGLGSAGHERPARFLSDAASGHADGARRFHRLLQAASRAAGASRDHARELLRPDARRSCAGSRKPKCVPNWRNRA